MRPIHRISLALQNILASSGGEIDSDTIESYAQRIQFILNDNVKMILSNTVVEERVLDYLIKNSSSYNSEDYSAGKFTSKYCTKVFLKLEELILANKLLNQSVAEQIFVGISSFGSHSIKDEVFDITKSLSYLSELETLRNTKDACLHVMQLIDEGSSREDIILEVDKRFISCESEDKNEKFTENEFYLYLEKLEKKRPLTYFPKLDSYLKNVLDTYIVIGARPNQGKTALAINILLNNIKHYTEETGISYFFSLEMTKAQIYSRLISMDMNIGFSTLITHRDQYMKDNIDLSFKDLFERYKDKIIIDDSSRLTVKMIIKKIRATQSQGKKISFIIIDYLQIMHSDIDFKDDNQKFTVISQGLKSIVKEFNFPVILLCQLNREVEKRLVKTPVKSDIKGCGAVEENADFIVMLDSPYDRNASHEIDRIDLVIVKNKFGEKGTVPTKFNKRSMLFEEKKDWT